MYVTGAPIFHSLVHVISLLTFTSHCVFIFSNSQHPLDIFFDLELDSFKIRISHSLVVLIRHSLSYYYPICLLCFQSYLSASSAF